MIRFAKLCKAAHLPTHARPSAYGFFLVHPEAFTTERGGVNWRVVARWLRTLARMQQPGAISHYFGQRATLAR